MSAPAPRRTAARPARLLVLLALFACLCVWVEPLWVLAWRRHIPCVACFRDTKDAQGRPREAWRWVEGRTIRISQLPHLSRDYAGPIGEGVRELVQEAGLAFDVQVVPMAPALLEAYRASLREKEDKGQRRTVLSFEAFESRLVGLRDGDPHADILVVDAPIADATWAYGQGVFRSGVIVIQQSVAGRSLGKHEACHMLGYQMHDSFPLFVLGYPWEGWPWSRDTLMLLASRSNALSPRALGALRAFWEGMERRTGGSYLRAPVPVAPRPWT